MEKRKNKWLSLFLAPYAIGAFAFILYPLFYSLYLSFTNRNLFGGKFIGIKISSIALLMLLFLNHSVIQLITLYW